MILLANERKDRVAGKPLHVRTLVGSPISAGGTSLVPEVQLVALDRRRGTVDRWGFRGWGWACVLLTPKAVIEHRGDRRQRIPVPDVTAQVLMAVAVLGLAVAVVCILVQVLAQPSFLSGKGGD